MLQKTITYGLKACGIDSAQTILLGFSGGPDSLALLHALKKSEFSVTAAHFDHALRPESAQDAERAKELATQLGAPFILARGDVSEFAQANKLSTEEAARELRYGFLFDSAKKIGAQAVLAAHHADDQVETVLMHLLRGAGATGLRGMALHLLPNPWSATVPLVRPLLDVWRQEIEQYCQDNELTPIQDSSNQETTFLRNRLRHEVIPFLEKVSPGVKTRLRNSAGILAADYGLLEGLANAAWLECLARRGPDYLTFDRSAFLAQPLALQRSLLRRVFADLKPQERNLDFEAIESALKAIKNPSGAPTDWLAGLYLLIEQDNIWIADWEADLPVDWPQVGEQIQHLEIPSSVQLNSSWRLTLGEANAESDSLTNSDSYQAWLDLDAAGDELALRPRRAGDHFQPLGMASGSLKLSDFMINEKMPKRARAGWPLVCKGDEIVWVPGYQLAHPFRLRENSRRALHLHLSKV